MPFTTKAATKSRNISRKDAKAAKETLIVISNEERNLSYPSSFRSGRRASGLCRLANYALDTRLEELS